MYCAWSGVRTVGRALKKNGCTEADHPEAGGVGGARGGGGVGDVGGAGGVGGGFAGQAEEELHFLVGSVLHKPPWPW